MTLPKILIASAAAAALIYVVFLGLMYFYQGAMIYPGARIRVAARLPSPPGAEVFRVSTALASVEAVFLPATRAADDPSQPVVIFGHGNGEVIDDWITALDGFRQRGIGVLLVEYPGYGRSTGSPSEAAIREVMDTAYDRIARDARVDRRRIFGFGESLGGGALCLLARDRPLRALILQSTFPSLDIFAARYAVPPILLRDHFDNLTSVAQFRGPVLVIHGREDPLIPWKQGQRLAAAAENSTFRLYDCGHVCWDPERQPFWQDAIPFLRSAGILQPMRDGT